MRYGLMRADKKGDHFELALRAIHQIKNADLLRKADDEWTYANILVTALQASKKVKPHINDQTRKEQEQRLIKVPAFSFDHIPDITIDNDGTAIEIKLIKCGNDLRDCLGQALIYRFAYRFAIMVLIDLTERRTFVESLRRKDSNEARLLRDMCDNLNIMTIIGPIGKSKNLAFVPKSSHRVKREKRAVPPASGAQGAPPTIIG
jgi:hypothetical protein